MAKQSPRLLAAAAWLRGGAHASSDSPGRRPTIRALAQRAGVSYTTMWKAIRETGSASGAGARSGVPNPRGPNRNPARSYQWCARAITVDVLDGRIGHDDFLPPLKQLAHQYRTTYRTIFRALEELCAQGLCRRLGARYIVRSVRHREQRASVMLVGLGANDGSFMPYGARTTALLGYLRNECDRCQVNLIPVPFFYIGQRINSSLFRTTLRKRSSGHPTLGTMLMAEGHPAIHLGSIISELDHHGRLAIVDEGADYQPPAARDAITIRIGISTAAGKAMGEHLIAAGHRRIAFLCRTPLVPWCATRLNGLRQAWSNANLPPQNVVLCAPRGDSVPELTMAAASSDDLIGVLARPLLRASGAQQFLGRALVQESSQLWTTAQRLARLQTCEELFAIAEDMGDVSAWVAENDDAALGALTYRARRRTRRRVAIVGFDDSEEALLSGLTSYNFNLPSVARLAIGWLTGTLAAAQVAEQPIEVSGFVSVRESG